MKERIFFADVELPFHAWARELTGEGYRWVLREVPGREAHRGGEHVKDRGPSKPSSAR
jgi:hypothetical protein